MLHVDLDKASLDQALLRELDAQIAANPDPQGHLIQILHDAQHLFGYLPPALQLHIAHQTNLPASRVNGVVTFYSFFHEEPEGRFNIAVCLGTACFVKGSEKVLAEFQRELGLNKEKSVSDDRLFALSDVRCIGACGLAPVVRVNDKIYGHVKVEDVDNIIAECRAAAAAEDSGEGNGERD